MAALTTKLINSVNHGTNLEDSLQSTRAELESARHEMQLLREQLDEETQKRLEAEKEKKRLDDEVDDLTQTLFQEAQNMVASARRDNGEMEQRNEQLKTQLKDAETLLASHQDQLRELKDMLQQNQLLEREPSETSVHPSNPGTPLIGPTGKSAGVSDHSSHAQNRQASSHVTPDHPLSFAHLISPILRTDLQGHEDFVAMLEAGRKAAPNSRVNSGNFAGLNVMGIGSLSNFRQSTVAKPTHAATNSTSSLSTSTSAAPHVPGSFNPSSPNEASSSPTIASTLKDQKFYKRALQEDIEPTLRLETAPGLSFFSKRNVVSSMVSGSLYVEPFGPSSRFWSATYSCALCGEERADEPYVRKHRFRTSDSDDAPRHMVCDYCLSRLQATGDFVNFLRMVRSGLWKSETAEDIRLAWEECTKLREKMFWTRIGGGVVPYQPTETISSPRKLRHPDPDESAVQDTPAQDGEIPELFQPKDVTRLSMSDSPAPVRRPGTSGDSSGSASFRAARSRFESFGSQSDAEKKRSPSRPATASYRSSRSVSPVKNTE